jgi:hypothetical protein
VVLDIIENLNFSLILFKTTFFKMRNLAIDLKEYTVSSRGNKYCLVIVDISESYIAVADLDLLHRTCLTIADIWYFC